MENKSLYVGRNYTMNYMLWIDLSKIVSLSVKRSII